MQRVHGIVVVHQVESGTLITLTYRLALMETRMPGIRVTEEGGRGIERLQGEERKGERDGRSRDQEKCSATSTTGK